MIKFILTGVLCCASAPALAFDFFKGRDFFAHYAYLDSRNSKTAQFFYSIDGVKRRGEWVMNATGMDPSASGSHAECKATFKGRTVAPNRLIAVDESGAFGKFEIFKEGDYVRVKSLQPGPCLKQGLYVVPQVVD